MFPRTLFRQIRFPALPLPRTQILLPPITLTRPVPRQQSTFSKLIKAVKGEDLPTERKGAVRMLEEALEEAKEANRLASKYRDRSAQSGSKGASVSF